MSGRGIGNLGKPPIGYRVDLGANAQLSGFETLKQSRDEDRFRAKRLRRAAAKYPDEINAEAALALATKLETAGEGGEVPNSLASSTFVRGQRVNIVGALWRLIRESGQ